MFRKLKALKTWHIFLVAVLCSEIFTLILNSLQSVLRWGYVSRDLVEIGIVDAFIVSIAVTSLAVPLLRHSSKVLLEKEVLQKEMDERTRTQEALRRNEAWLKVLLETTSDWIWEVNEHCIYTYASHKVKDLLGYEPDELLGRTPFDLMPPEEAEKVREEFAGIARLRQPFAGLENVNLHKDGRLVFLETSGVPIFDDEGTFLGYRGMDRDVTERKTVGDELARKEERYRQLFKNNPHCMWAYDKKTLAFLAVNDAAVSKYGFSRDEFLSMTIADIRPPEDVSALKELVSQLPDGLRRSGIWRHRKKDGTIMDVEIVSHSITLDGRDASLVSVHDLTEQKRAEAALRESEARLREAQQIGGIGNWELDTADDSLWWSDEAYHLFGMKERSGISFESFIGRVHPDDRQRVRDAIQEAVCSHMTSWQIEYRIVLDSGETRYMYERGKAELDDLGNVAGRRGVVQDITLQKLAEEQKQKLEEQIRQTQRLESLGLLAGGIAHDFNNLLQGVFGYLSMARISIKDPERVLAKLEQAEKALHLSVNLTAQLLTFAKGGTPVKKLTALSAVIKNAVGFALSGSNCSCRVDIDESLWPVDADEGQISQAIQNIALNADQAMPLGGMVEVCARNIDASGAGGPSALEKGKYVAISLRDAGIGIPEEFLPRIFDPYFTTKEKGSGIGLTSAYSIIRQHGGLIDVASRVGEGSVFTIYIPASEASIKQSEPPVIPAVAEKAGNILVMDDEDIVRYAAEQLIAALGHNVKTARRGEEALALYQEARASGTPFDCVILDLTIRGGMGGIETLRRLKENDPDVKAIVSSGYSDDSAMSRHSEHGFIAALKKPYAIEGLRDVLNGVLKLSA